MGHPSHPSENGDMGSVLPGFLSGGGTLLPTGPAYPTGSQKMDWAGMAKFPHLPTQAGGSSLQHRTEEDPEAKSGLSRKCGDSISNGSKEDGGPCARGLPSRSRELCKWRNHFS